MASLLIAQINALTLVSKLYVLKFTDRTVDERRAYKKLVEELKAKKSEELDKFFVIRNSKVFSVPKDGQSAKGADP